MVHRVSEKEIKEGKGCVLKSSGKLLGVAVGLEFIQLMLWKHSEYWTWQEMQGANKNRERQVEDISFGETNYQVFKNIMFILKESKKPSVSRRELLC